MNHLPFLILLFIQCIITPTLGSSRVFVEDYERISFSDTTSFGRSIDVMYFDGSLQMVVGDPNYANYGAVFIIWLYRNGTVEKSSVIRYDTGFGIVNNGNNFGHGVTTYKDLDGDRVPELLVGAAADDTIWLIYLHKNGTVKQKKKILASDISAPYTISLGSDITVIGDLDRDGYPEIAIGSYRYDSNKGAVWIVWLNGTGMVKKSQQISQSTGGFTAFLQYGDMFGFSVSVIPDLDRDRVPELAVGAVGADGNRGSVWILFLERNGTVKSHQQIGSNKGGLNFTLPYNVAFGSSLAFTTDLDGDNVPELVVGCALDSTISYQRGSIWILYLDRDGSVKDQQHIYDGEISSGFNAPLSDNYRFGRGITFVPGSPFSPYSRLIVGAPLELSDFAGGTVGPGSVFDLTIFAYCESNFENDCLSPCFNPLNDPYTCNLLSNITDPSSFNRNISINNLTVSIEAEVDIKGNVDVNSSMIDIGSFFNITGTLHTTHNSVIEFQRNGTLVVGGCIDFEENTLLFLNLTMEEKLETGVFVLATTSPDCVMKRSQLPKTTCNEDGFQEKFKFDGSELQVIYSTCLQPGYWILIFAIITVVIVTFILLVLFTPLRKVILPYRRDIPTNHKNPYRSQPMNLN